MDAPPLLNQRYDILHALGSGGFGETFLAEDTQMPSGRRCVVKQLKPVTDNPEIYQLVQERFQREAAILEELGSHHGQIPALYAYFRENDLFYLVQEWIEGQSLAEYICTHGPMRESSVRAMLTSLLSVLEYVHSRQIVHRDIKPDNIMLRSSNLEPVLLDFGAVKETMGTVVSQSGNPTRSVVVGTPGFMASEQAIGRPVYSSDLYALGLTAIFALTGKTPQEFPTDPATGSLLWRNDAPNITPSFANAIDRAIQSHADRRFLNAREMRDALNTGSNTAPPVAMGTSPGSTIVSGPPTGQAVTPPPAATVVSSPQTAGSQNYPSQNYPSQNYPSSAPYPSEKRGMPEWGKAALTGGVIGISIVAGLVLSRPSEESSEDTASNPATPQPTATPVAAPQQATSQAAPQQQAPAATPIPTPVPTPIPTPVPTPEPVRRSTSSITEGQAVSLVNNWLQSKSQMFAPPYNKTIARRLTTGALLADLLKPDGPIDWLRNNNAYYQYGVQRIDSVQRFDADGNNATIELIITEDGTLYKNGRPDPGNAYFTTTLYRYTLEQDGGNLKISWYQKVE